MKKILLSAMASLAFGIVGCKKATDAAKESKLSQKEEGKAVFAAFDKVGEKITAIGSAQAKTDRSVNDLYDAVLAFEAALEKIAADYPTDTQTNVQNIKNEGLVAECKELKDDADGSTDFAADKKAVTNVNPKGAYEKVKDIIDAAKQKAVYQN